MRTRVKRVLAAGAGHGALGLDPLDPRAYVEVTCVARDGLSRSAAPRAARAVRVTLVSGMSCSPSRELHRDRSRSISFVRR